MVLYKDLELESNKIDTVVLAGGAYYGLLYIGLIKFLEDYNIYNSINNTYGVSIGSIFALLICLKIEYKTLLEYLTTIFNPNEFIKVNGADVLNIIEDYGVNDGNIVENTIKKLLEINGYSPYITFKELYEATNVKLNIGLVKLIANEFILINHINYPDYPVWLAIRASVSVPFIFNPIKDIILNDILIDGGMLNNLPVRNYLLEYYYSDYGQSLLKKQANDKLKKKTIVKDKEKIETSKNDKKLSKKMKHDVKKSKSIINKINKLTQSDSNNNNLENNLETIKYNQNFISININQNIYQNIDIHNISFLKYIELVFNKLFTNQHHHREKYLQYTCNIDLDMTNEYIKKIKLFNNELTMNDYLKISDIGYNYVLEYYNNILLKK